ncbi:hypothetical protein PF001_g32400 [Phytophthora fragariae]|uniref:Uncharacterized protein n=1 Tax=Phytophthora fragariae TaxID=53985 RepID=A0A6A4AUJ0_9STRA|nr:hypothetical protein PF001_g32400 [Phytophthora fragariae]
MGDSFCNLGANNKISDCSEGSAGPEPGGSPVSSAPLAQTHAHQSSEPHLRRYNALLSASESTLTLERQCVKLEALAPNDSLRRHGGNGVVLHGALFKTELK